MKQQKGKCEGDTLNSVWKFSGSVCLCLFEQEYFSLHSVLGCRDVIDVILDLYPGKKLLSWKTFLYEAVSGRNTNIASFIRQRQ